MKKSLELKCIDDCVSFVVPFLSRECACAMNDLSLSVRYRSGGKFV